MTTFKMPEPVAEFRQGLFGNGVYLLGAEPPTGTQLYTANALRDVLEQAARIAFDNTIAVEDEWDDGFNQALKLVERSIREMIKEIPE